MRVSIVIPTYKGSNQLSRAIDSVLNQTYKECEIIVVDDNVPESEERRKTEKVMMSYAADERVRYQRHSKNLNGAAARNTGISVAKGDYIAFLDDDDYYLPDRIEKSLDYFRNNKDAVGVYVGVDILYEDGMPAFQVIPNHDLKINDLLQKEMTIGTGSNIFVKSDVIKRINGFDENFSRRQDIEFMIRVCHEGRVGYLPDKMIVKSVNGTINYPSYAIMKKLINLFSTNFEKDIVALGDDKQKYYAMQYRALFNVALYERNKEEINEAALLIKEYDKLSLTDKLRKYIYIYNIRDNALVKRCIKLRRYVKSKSKMQL